MILQVQNFDVSNAVTTFLSSPASATDTTLNVKNNAGFNNNDFVVIGNISDEKTEIVQINGAISGNTSFTVTALKFDHSTDTSVTYLKFNQVKFFKSTDGGVTYNLLATVGLQVDRPITTYDDTLAQPTYFYKSQFFNSYTNLLSIESSILPGSGYPWYALLTLQDRILDLFPDPKEQVLNRDQLTDWINEEYRTLTSLASKIDQGIFLKSNELTPSHLTANQNTYAFPSDFKSVKKIEIALDGVTYYRAYPQQVGFGSPDMVYDQTAPIYVSVSNTFQIRPTPLSNSGLYKIWYYYLPIPLSADSDVVDLSLRPYLDALITHALARGKQKDKKYDEAAYWDNETEKIEVGMVNELQGRTTTDIPRWVDISDTSFLDADESWLWDC